MTFNQQIVERYCAIPVFEAEKFARREETDAFQVEYIRHSSDTCVPERFRKSCSIC